MAKPDNEELAIALIGVLDLTNLNDDASADDIEALCHAATSPHGPVAALCLHAKWLRLARNWRDDSDILLATVANFPDGTANSARINKQVLQALDEGADEIDVVLPYREFLAGGREKVGQILARVRESCKDRTLKVILESEVLGTRDNIYAASRCALDAGADFIKTSTGKLPQGATYEAAETMLQAISDHGGDAGFKASGGVRTFEQAANYAALVEKHLGKEAFEPKRFRIGASSLLKDLLSHCPAT